MGAIKSVNLSCLARQCKYTLVIPSNYAVGDFVCPGTHGESSLVEDGRVGMHWLFWLSITYASYFPIFLSLFVQQQTLRAIGTKCDGSVYDVDVMLCFNGFARNLLSDGATPLGALVFIIKDLGSSFGIKGALQLCKRSISKISTLKENLPFSFIFYK